MLQNDYLSNRALRNTDCGALFFRPYVEASKNFKAVKNAPGNLSAFKHVVVGILLLIPIINTIAMLILRSYCSYRREEPIQPPSPRNITPIVVQNNPIASQLVAQPTVDDRKPVLFEYANNVHKNHYIAIPEEVRSLTECRSTPCITPLGRAHNVDTKILEQADAFPRDRTLRYVSIGAGGMLQDWVLLAQLIQKGFTKISVKLVDRAYNREFNLPKNVRTCECVNGKDVWISKDIVCPAYEWPKMKKEFTESLKIIGASELEVETFDNVDDCLCSIGKEPVDILVGIDIYSHMFNDIKKIEPNLLAREEGEKTNSFALYATGGEHPTYYRYNANEIAQRISGMNIASLLDQRTRDMCHSREHITGKLRTVLNVAKKGWLPYLRALNHFNGAPFMIPMLGC